MTEADLYPFFNDNAVLVLGADKRVKDCSSGFLQKFGLFQVPTGTHIDTLFNMQGKDLFACCLTWQPFRCVYCASHSEVSGFLTGFEDGYRLVFDIAPVAQTKTTNHDKRYELITHTLHEGIAVNTLIFKDGQPVDYVLDKVNADFETIIPLKYGDAADKRASVLFNGEVPFLSDISEACLSKETRQIERYWPQFDKHIRLSVVPWDDSRFALVLSDLTQSVHMNLLQKTLNQAANHMSYALETAEIFDAAAAVLRQNGFECMLILLDSDSTIKETYLSFGDAPRIYRDKGVLSLSASFKEAVAGRRTVYLDSFDIIPDALADCGISPNIKGIAAPLVVSDTFYGIFVIISAALKEYEAAPVTVFANLLAAMVERTMLVQRLQDHVHELELSKKAQEETAQQLKMTSHASHIGFWEYAYDKGFVYIDDMTMKMHGVSDTFDGRLKTWIDVVHPDDRRKTQAAFNRSMRTGRDCKTEFRIVRDDGEVRYVRTVGVLQKNDKGESICLSGTVWDITDIKMVEKALRDSERQLRRIFNLLPVGLWMTDKEGRLLKSNPAGKQIWGVDLLSKADNFDKLKLRHYPSGEEIKTEDWALYKTVRTGESYRNEMLEIDTYDGQKKIILSDTAPVVDESGNVQAVIMIHRDITENEKAKAALKSEKELLGTTLKSIGEGVVVTDSEGRITIVNTAFEQLSGWTQEASEGRLFSEVVQTFTESDNSLTNLVEKTLRTGVILSGSNGIVMVCRDGKHKPIAHTVSPIRNDNGDIFGTVLVIRDITEEEKKQKKIDYLVYHDALTGVYNRRYWDQIIKKVDIPENLPISVLSCDVNGLKLTNDAFGHNSGDKLLIDMASILIRACRPSDVVVRSGGDEFLVLMAKTDANEADKVCRDIKALSAKNKLHAIRYSVSVGYETKRYPSESLQAVINKAEAYMYRNKSFESPYMRGSSINDILLALHEKNRSERLHACHVSEICAMIASAMGLSEREISEIGTIGNMHDIGKIAIDQRMLCKPDRLTEEEWVDMKRHPEVGFRILAASTDTAHIAKSVLAHHERFDGGGYPNGLKGDNIPVMARILAVADAYEAMTNERPYRMTKTRDQALEEIETNKGKQFDPAIADVFLRLQSH